MRRPRFLWTSRYVQSRLIDGAGMGRHHPEQPSATGTALSPAETTALNRIEQDIFPAFRPGSQDTRHKDRS